jgi:hypothetical protein
MCPCVPDTPPTLCRSCYSRFEVYGTLERQQHPLAHSKAARADLTQQGQVAAEGEGRAGKRKAACQDDDMRGGGGSSALEGGSMEGGGGKRKKVAESDTTKV